MRELHGVLYAGHPGLDLKRRALLFDKFHIWDFQDEQYSRSEDFLAELSFLQSTGMVVPAPSLNQYNLGEAILPSADSGEHLHAQIKYAHQTTGATEIDRAEATLAVVRDRTNRVLASSIRDDDRADIVPICELDMPDTLAG